RPQPSCWETESGTLAIREYFALFVMSNVPGANQSSTNESLLSSAKRTCVKYSTKKYTGLIKPAGFKTKEECVAQATTLYIIIKLQKLEKMEKIETYSSEIGKKLLQVIKGLYHATRLAVKINNGVFDAMEYKRDTPGVSVPGMKDKIPGLLFADDAFNDQWNNKAFFRANKIKTFKSYMACCSILKRNDMPTKFKVMVIKAIIQAVATYGGKWFEMSATRCKPIQQVVDAATQTLAKCGKSAAITRLRQELSLTDLNIKTVVARTRAFSKWINSHTVIKNHKLQISKCIDDIEAGTSCNWMGLELLYPELKTHIKYVFKIRNGTYWTARRYAKSGVIEKRVQVATQPPLLFTLISMRLVGKLLGEELKLSGTRICKDPTVLCVKTTMSTAKFLNAIALP
ncbi:hypothetical protein BB561_005878, partial [Smittium simulii]